MRRIAVVVLLIFGVVPWVARGEGSRYTAGIESRLRSIEKLLNEKDWERALNRADELLFGMAAGDFRGPGSRAAYGLAFAFRALAAEELGRHQEADWDWGCARALAENVVGFDFSPLGEAQQRIVERESSRTGPPPSWKELEEEHGDLVLAPKKVTTKVGAYPVAWRQKRREREAAYSLRIGLDGLPRDPRPVSEEDLSTDTSIFVYTLLWLGSWKFEPARLGGEPIEIRYELTTYYKLR